MTDQELFLKAKELLPMAYAPYSHFQVGAALLTDTGEVFTGVNVENSSFGATICAERTACVKAVSAGFRKFSALAVVSCEGEVFPCGICRQFLFEFGDELRIITGTDIEHLHSQSITELLKDGFRL